MKTPLILSMIACTARLVQADGAAPNFADDVLPILRQSCLGCHSDDKQRGGLNLATFAATMQGGSSGAAVKPGQPEASRLFTLTNHSEEPKMPPKADKIPAAQIDTLRKWIEQGARENAGSKAVAMAPKPANNLALNAAVKGRPAGPPPMPGKLMVEPAVQVKRSGAVTALAASPWAPVAAIGGAKQIQLVNTDTAEPLGVLPFPAGQVNSLRFSRGGRHLLAAGGRGGKAGVAVLFDLTTGKPVVEVGKETDAILAADISADQSQIAVGGPSKIVRVYSTADGSIIREIKKHTDWVTAIEYSPDGVLLASGDRNGGLHIWEAGTGREFFTLKGPTQMIASMSWRDDGNVVAVASEDATIRLFEMENGTQIKQWGAHGGGAACVRFAHDGRLVSIGRDRTPKLWDANGAQQKSFEPFNDLGLQVAISHDSTRIIAGDWTGEVRIWTIADGKRTATFEANPLNADQKRERILKEIAAIEAKLKQAEAALAAGKKDTTAAMAELAATEAEVQKANQENEAAQKLLAAAKPMLDQWNGALAGAQRAEGAKQLSAEALLEAQKKVSDASGKQPNHAELKAEAAKLAEIVKLSQAELAAAKKESATAAAKQKDAAAKQDQATKAAAATNAALANAKQKLDATRAKHKPAMDRLAQLQGMVNTHQNELNEARKKLDQLPKK